MTEPFPCPRCNSSQDFSSKERQAGTLPWKEVYTRCKMCRYELVIGYTTDEIEMLRMRSKGVQERLSYEVARHGLPTQSTLKQASMLARKMQDAMLKLEADMDAINGRR